MIHVCVNLHMCVGKLIEKMQHGEKTFFHVFHYVRIHANNFYKHTDNHLLYTFIHKKPPRMSSPPKALWLFSFVSECVNPLLACYLRFFNDYLFTHWKKLWHQVYSKWRVCSLDKNVKKIQNAYSWNILTIFVSI